MLQSGIRWYKAFPTPLTQLVIAQDTALWVGGDPNPTPPYSSLTEVATFPAQTHTAPVSFAPVRDPSALAGAGSDILIITGYTSSNQSFASGALLLSGTPAAGQTVTVTVNAITTLAYTVVSTDTLDSIGQQIVTLINESSIVTPGHPVLGQSYTLNGTVFLGALVSGVSGNAITYKATVTGSGLAVSPSTASNLAGGGGTFFGPLKWDGSTLSGLSYQIAQNFTGCVTWHDHVWYWGDPNNPGTLYASDIDNPESFAFMITEGPYEIGQGDGDPYIRAVVPVGNILYVFKSNSIYAITGYDFQSGEYQFNVQPAVRGIGTPNSCSATVQKNALYWWSGRAFYRLTSGSYTPEYIGAPIPITQGLAANGNASLVRAVAGDFVVESLINESFSSNATAANQIMSSCVYFAMDVGNGVADTVLVYDDDASNRIGQYAWSVWKGWNVTAWVPFGGGMSVSGIISEPPILCWIPPVGTNGLTVIAFGTSPSADSGLPINFLAQTGWVTLETPALIHNLHRIFLDLESTSGVFISFTVTPSVSSAQNGQAQSQAPFQAAFGATGGILDAEVHQTLIAKIEPFLHARAFVFAFGENTATSNFELTELTLDYIEEPFRP